MSALEVNGMSGHVRYNLHSDSYILTVYAGGRPILAEVFGNGVKAEDRLLDLLEFPEWTMLRYG